MRLTRWFPPALGAIVLAGALGIASSAEKTLPKGDPARGKKVYNARKCDACHKADGSGGFKVTGNPTPDWRDSTRMADPKYDDEFLRDCIINGKPESGMVAWGKQGMKAADVEHLIAYIRTFSTTKKAAAKKSK